MRHDIVDARRVMVFAALSGLYVFISSAAVAVADDVVKVPMIAPFSGQVAFYGEGYRRGFDVALSEVGGTVNGHKIEVSNIDDQCTPEGAVSQVRKISDDAVVSVGPACTGAMLAVQKLLETAGIPHIFTGYGASVTEKGDKLVYRSSVSDKMMAQRIVAWAKEKFGITKWGVVHDTTGFGAGGAKTFAAAVKDAGAELVVDNSYNPGEREFTGMLLNTDKAGPQAVYAIGYEVELGLLVKQAGQAGIKARLIGSPPFANPEMALAAGDYANGLYFTTLFLIDNPAEGVKKFVDETRVKFKAEPKDVDAIGYAAGLMLIDALKRINGPVTKENLAKQLAVVNIPASPLGPIKLDSAGERVGDGLVTIGVIKNGKAAFEVQR